MRFVCGPMAMGFRARGEGEAEAERIGGGCPPAPRARAVMVNAKALFASTTPTRLRTRWCRRPRYPVQRVHRQHAVGDRERAGFGRRVARDPIAPLLGARQAGEREFGVGVDRRHASRDELGVDERGLRGSGCLAYHVGHLQLPLCRTRRDDQIDRRAGRSPRCWPPGSG